MGIRFYCPNGCKLHVKAFQAGRRGICPHCGTGVDIPLKSTRPASKEKRRRKGARGGVRGAESVNEPDRGGGRLPPGSDEETELLPAGPLEVSGRGGGPAALPGRPPLLTVPAGTEVSAAAPAPPRSDIPPPLPAMTGSSAEGAMGTEPFPSVPNRSPPGAGAPSVPADAPGALPEARVPPVGEASGAGMDPLTAAGASLNEPDALRDAPDVIWYIRPPSGGQYGPASRDVMRAWLAEGRITPDSLVWREGWRDWKEAIQVFPDGAFPQLRVPDAVPGLDRVFDGGGPAVSASHRHGSARRSSVLRQVASVLVFFALAGGVLVAIYMVVSGRWFR